MGSKLNIIVKNYNNNNNEEKKTKRLNKQIIEIFTKYTRTQPEAKVGRKYFNGGWWDSGD